LIPAVNRVQLLMVYEPLWEDPPKRRKKETRGAPHAMKRYRKLLKKNPNRWARLVTFHSSVASEAVVEKWAKDYPEFEFKWDKGTIWGRFSGVQRLSQSQSQTQSVPGAFVRAPVVEEDPEGYCENPNRLAELKKLPKYAGRPDWEICEEEDLMWFDKKPLGAMTG